MDKKRPTYDLDEVKADLVSPAPEQIWITATARKDAAALGISDGRIAEIVQSVKRSDFYKSMTSNSSHTIWQDVYHVKTGLGPREIILCLKFQRIPEGRHFIISFKEK